ncbi:MAG TPA: pyridoxamine 5'-phosphate oxidase family protein [Vicinamibacterales bacterium]|nr:pyridoxamine 5'-phosphate oxidase family protein [Vicinamibacterales bacterium]
MSERFSITPRTRVVRLPDRASYDRQTLFAILDEAFLCHVAFSVNGQPYAVPMAFGRDDQHVYLHASAASRMARGAIDGLDVGVTVTLLDGLVMARSAFHHSMNHRSVMVVGRARLVTDATERQHALRRIVEHVLAGRWDEVRPPSEKELKATAVLALPLVEVSGKIRTGPPGEEDEDYTLPVWAGVIPLRTIADQPEDDGRLVPGVRRLDERRIATRVR